MSCILLLGEQDYHSIYSTHSYSYSIRSEVIFLLKLSVIQINDWKLKRNGKNTYQTLKRKWLLNCGQASQTVRNSKNTKPWKGSSPLLCLFSSDYLALRRVTSPFRHLKTVQNPICDLELAPVLSHTAASL